MNALQAWRKAKDKNWHDGPERYCESGFHTLNQPAFKKLKKSNLSKTVVSLVVTNICSGKNCSFSSRNSNSIKWISFSVPFHTHFGQSGIQFSSRGKKSSSLEQIVRLKQVELKTYECYQRSMSGLLAFSGTSGSSTSFATIKTKNFGPTIPSEVEIFSLKAWNLKISQ